MGNYVRLVRVKVLASLSARRGRPVREHDSIYH